MNRQTVKVKQSLYRPGQTLSVPGDETPRYEDNRHMKLVRSALRTGRLYPLFLLENESTPRLECGRKDYVNKNSNDTTGDRTRYFLVCSAVPQPTAPPHVPLCKPEDSQITSSSSHLRKASPRLELRTLAGYLQATKHDVTYRCSTSVWASEF